MFLHRYVKVVPFLFKMVYKRVRHGWTLGRNLPIEKFLEYSPRNADKRQSKYCMDIGDVTKSLHFKLFINTLSEIFSKVKLTFNTERLNELLTHGNP